MMLRMNWMRKCLKELKNDMQIGGTRIAPSQHTVVRLWLHEFCRNFLKLYMKNFAYIKKVKLKRFASHSDPTATRKRNPTA